MVKLLVALIIMICYCCCLSIVALPVRLELCIFSSHINNFGTKKKKIWSYIINVHQSVETVFQIINYKYIIAYVDGSGVCVCAQA